MTLYIQKENEELIDTSELITLQRFQPSAPTRIPIFQEIDGRRGSLPASNALTTRTINVEFYFKARDNADFVLRRDELHSLFDSEEPFYIIDSRQPFKRWRVNIESWDFEDVALISKHTITFTAMDGMCESTGSTLTPLTFDSESWGIGQHLLAEDQMYTFTGDRFRVYNAGDIEVDPREKPMTITFKGASENLSIRNVTLGQSWKYYGTSDSHDTIKLDRVFFKKNDKSIFNDTNRMSLKLVKGWNEFTVSGATSTFEIAFDFRFYYL
ncbi:phage tail family protein [Peribacillus simplex]|uniref:Phage tail family protein n=2 Tax=Peribacillus TaxID=2675229 RepID=A0AA90PJU9_9BACI|nr:MULTISPECIES: phage tail family protein [Peribacillus]MDP1419227.1 phage tail family protein [Peribacillus simplex]MDP1452135.1 phage tail family protein [Peribacillus frigoritolerans]